VVSKDESGAGGRLTVLRPGSQGILNLGTALILNEHEAAVKVETRSPVAEHEGSPRATRKSCKIYVTRVVDFLVLNLPGLSFNRGSTIATVLGGQSLPCPERLFKVSGAKKEPIKIGEEDETTDKAEWE
jgi:hypothetical protein